ncbi:MAG: hypothetical protein R2751_14690 [Bacteroidales bacterium]
MSTPPGTGPSIPSGATCPSASSRPTGRHPGSESGRHQTPWHSLGSLAGEQLPTAIGFTTQEEAEKLTAWLFQAGGSEPLMIRVHARKIDFRKKRLADGVLVALQESNCAIPGTPRPCRL